MAQRRFLIGWVFAWLLGSTPCFADLFHYRNILIGDRAIGMGGAYAAVSDDASGVFYNPAGLSFALSNDVSGSANAIYQREVIYENTVAGEDFSEYSNGTLPSFFGGLQKLDHIAKGLVFAFGAYTTDAELKDQDDTITNKDLGKPPACAKLDADGNETFEADGSVARGEDTRKLYLDRFHRTVQVRASSFYFGVAAGYRIASTFSVGVGLNYVAVDELVQEYQDVRTQQTYCQSDGGFQERVEQKEQNIRQQVRAFGVQPVFGLQWAFADRWSVGLTAKAGTYVSQNFEQSFEARSTALTPTDQGSVDSAPGSIRQSTGSALVSQNVVLTKHGAPIGSMPLEVRLGVAHFHSTRLLLTFDAVTYTAVKNTPVINNVDLYGKEAVTNYAAGLEYYLIPSVPFRLGVFTNNDARPKLDKNRSGQRDHIDYTGATVFLAWVQPNSQIGAGVMLQQGKGEAQKVGGSTVIQKVKANAFTFAFSATHSF